MTKPGRQVLTTIVVNILVPDSWDDPELEAGSDALDDIYLEGVIEKVVKTAIESRTALKDATVEVD